MTFARFLQATAAVICLTAPALAAPGYVGIYLEDMDTKENGALIQDVAPNSPAQAAGLRQGDLVIEWEGTPVKGSQDLIPLLKRSQAGQRVSLAITRDGWRKALTMTLGGAPSVAPVAPRTTLPAPKERGFLGVYLRQSEGGAPVLDGVLDDSPAKSAGLQRDDQVLSVNGKDVTDAAGMIAEVGQHGPGDTLVFAVRRQGKTVKVKVTLGKRPAEPGVPQVAPKLKPAQPTPPVAPSADARPYIGMALDDAAGKGPLKVDDVKAQGPADRFGVRKGDVLLKVDGQAIKTVEDFVRVFGGKKAGEKIVFRIERDGWQHDVPVVIGSR